MNEPKQFWMVYRIGGRGSEYRHPTLESAETEARRLARANLDQTFVVLEAVSAVTKREFDTVTFRSAAVPKSLSDAWRNLPNGSPSYVWSGDLTAMNNFDPTRNASIGFDLASHRGRTDDIPF